MKRWQIYCLGFLFLLFLFLHFYALNEQEFIGDEASPMLSIDRMWDAISLHDIRFLGYPFLFYIDPYRSIFSGTLLHFFGPDRILLRLPSIFFSMLTYFFLLYIFLKEKINPWIITLSLFAFVCSGITINDRSGGGDAQTRFFILVAGYYLWQTLRFSVQRHIKIALLSWAVGMITMLDSVVLLPALVYAIWKKRFFKQKKILFLIMGIILFFSLYFSLWILLPYLAFKSGYQHYLSNRGLFYYLSVAKSGSAKDSFNSIGWFIHYTSLPFVLWASLTTIYAFFVKKFRGLQIITIPAWIAILLLKGASFHVIMYAGLFLLQAVIMTNYLFERFPKIKYGIIVVLFMIFLTNSINLFTQYAAVFQQNNETAKVHKNSNCLDEAVQRIYKHHNTKPLNTSCTYPRIQ